MIFMCDKTTALGPTAEREEGVTMKAMKYFALVLVLVLACGSGQSLFAQGTDLGTITGSVTDSSGAMVPNAKVTILDLATNSPRETKTNAEGVYRVFGLRPGAYMVSVTAPNRGTTRLRGFNSTAAMWSMPVPY